MTDTATRTEKKLFDCQWWLAELDQHGNPTLIDGVHRDRADVERAAYLMNSLGLTRGRKFATAQVILTDVTPRADGVNQKALATLQSIGLRPPTDT